MNKEKTGTNVKNGLLLSALGQFFYGENFNEPAFISGNGVNGFNIEGSQLEGISLDKKIKSVRWLADFTPKKSGLYQFNLPESSFWQLVINGVKSKNKELTLTQGEIYSFLITYSGNGALNQENLFRINMQLYFNHQLHEIDPRDFSLPSKNVFHHARILENEEDDVLIDTDEDGIYDKWELQGYTAINRIIFPWKDEYGKQGYKKFVSNPNEPHTAADPYSDLEKVTGSIDRGISKVAWDPMIAAYPNITVGMELLILSDNKDFSASVGANAIRETSSSTTASNTEGMDVNAGFSLWGGFTGMVSGNYSHTSSQTVNSVHTSGQDWTESISLNKGQAAFLNANIRYYNTGTCPVYKFEPTTSLVLGKQTVATITGQENQEAYSLSPDETYPQKHLHAIALNTLDQFSSTPVSLNFEQVVRLENGEKLKLETTQFKGCYAKRDAAGGEVVVEDSQWANYIPQIKKVTAGILLDIYGESLLEFRVAAKDPTNPNDRTPQLTLGQVLEKTVQAYQEKGRWYFDHNDEKIILSPNLVAFICDEKTKKMMLKEQKANPKLKDAYDMVIRPGMNIHICIPSVWDDFKVRTTDWQGGEFDEKNGIEQGQCYKIFPSASVMLRFKKELNTNHRYLLTMDVKGGPNEGMLQFGGISRRFVFQPNYKKQTMILETFGVSGDFSDLIITTTGNVGDLYLDNFSIIKLGGEWDKLREENKEFAKRWNQAIFTISNLNMNRFLANEEGKVFLLGWQENGASTQQFMLVYDTKRGAFFIHNDFKMKSLTIDSLRQLRFQPNMDGNLKTQLWFLREVEKNKFLIISAVLRDHVLTIDHLGPDPIPVTLEPLSTEKNQLFVFKKTDISF